MLSSNTRFNVFLSGGGMKGGYQYGFFKQIYKKCPEFQIEKIFCASVGSLNALPIMTKRLDELKHFWEPEVKFPIDDIFNPWTCFGDAHKNRTVFHSMNTKHLEEIFNGLSPEERYRVYKNITVLAYNKKKKIPHKFKNLFFKKDFLYACNVSSCYPSLIPQINKTITDGAFVGEHVLVPYFESTSDPWVVLDISNTFEKGKGKYKNCYVFTPNLSPISYTIGAMNISKSFIDKLVSDGEKDADELLKMFAHKSQVFL